MRLTLLNHQTRRIPEHFKQTNRGKYNHFPRNERYKSIKRRKHHSITDLVKTGRTRDKMSRERPVIRIGGTADSTLVGRMELKFPFPVGGQYQLVGPQQMAKEIEAWTPEEQERAAQEFETFYYAEIRQFLESAPRIRKRIEAEALSLGETSV